MKTKLLKLMGKNILTGSMFATGILVVILGVSAFETLGTTPGTGGNQSLGSQILSKLSSGGFDRTTDSLEALSDKIDAVAASGGGGGYFTKCQAKHSTTAIYPTCPSGFTNVHNYASAMIRNSFTTTTTVAGFYYATTIDTSWYYNHSGSEYYSTYACTVCEKN